MDSRAKRVIAHLAASLDTPYHGSSSMTPAVYDTAWVAMVSKEETHDGETTSRWLFPECFQSVLESQTPDGGFGVNGAQVDGILCTMAAILVLSKYHLNPSIQGCTSLPEDLPQRIENGRAFLNEALQAWDVQSTVHVGFEILVPSLLRTLEDHGHSFQFSDRALLMAMNKRKLDRIKPAVVCRVKTTLLHSLEAFIGHIDFDKMSHFLDNGSMMGSPSSTAAYLMNATKWDREAERYLSFVVASGKGRVPSAFPVGVFETSWVLSTLLSAGLTASDLGEENVSKLAEFLEARLQGNAGVTGFASGMLPDADDTAKAIHTLNLLGRSTKCEPMFEAFGTSTHFKTYNLEANESFSANCNVLIASLGSEDVNLHTAPIEKALRFLCRAWYENKWSDKWNTEPQYPMMLLAEALVRIVKLCDAGKLGGIAPELLVDRIPIVTLQMLIRTLSSQSEDGSWKNSPEITAYGVLTLKKLAILPWATTAAGEKIAESISLGTKFLEANKEKWNNPGMFWVEKVTYGSSILSESYCLASMNAPSHTHSWSPKIANLCTFHDQRLQRFTKFFSHLPVFKDEPIWRLRASIVEGYMFAPLLKRSAKELDIFPQREKEGTPSKYLEYIPLTWTTCNNAAQFGISTQVLFDMIVISLLNFQIDKWLEDATEDKRLGGDFAALKIVVHKLFEGKDGERGAQLNGSRKRMKLSNGNSHEATNGISDVTTNGNGEIHHEDQKNLFLEECETALSKFVTFVTAKASGAAPGVARRVHQELSTFVQAHVTHGEDNARMVKPEKATDEEAQLNVFSQARTTYFDWVRTTSADHTSCPYSFEFFRCLLSAPLKGKDCFPSTRGAYLSQDVCRHLATMCRQYNDYGSVARDRAENNLNSINFPEFHQEGDFNEGESGNDGTVKQTLLDIADYERECLDLATQRLKKEVAAPVFGALKVFIDVTDLYGQIYVVRDINNSAAAK